MKYPKDYLDEIKVRLKVSKVVSRSVKLKKRGKEFIGLSPFSNEKTPSFTVNDEKGFYHCFSTAQHGNIFDFLMKTENLKFGEAVKKLALEAGMSVYKFTKYDEEKERKWKIYSSLLEEYANFSHQKLLSGKFLDVNAYLKKRNIRNEEIVFFKIGYVEFNSNFYDRLKMKFSNEEIIDAGLFYFDEKNKKYIERFRGRIIFPIKNVSGSIIAFGGRIINASKFAKYINLPETSFYKKGNNLFNINNVRKMNNKKNEVILVEGYIDVISLQRFGIPNIISNQGTALTDNQMDLIWRFFKNLMICFDGDKGGRDAALRSAEKLFPFLKAEHSINFLFLPNDFDPDSFINKNGRDAFIKLIENKIAIYDFIWDCYYQNIDTNNPASFASFEKKIRLLCKQVIDEHLSKYFLEYFTRKLTSLTPFLNLKRDKYTVYKKISSPLSETKKTYRKKDKFSERILKEYSLIYLIINNLNFFSKKIENISEISFSDKLANKLIKMLLNNLAANNVSNKETFDDIFDHTEYKNFISEINDITPIKTIVANKTNNEIELIFNEICKEITNIDLSRKIESLENKMIKKMDEKTYQELLNLKSQLKNF